MDGVCFKTRASASVNAHNHNVPGMVAGHQGHTNVNTTGQRIRPTHRIVNARVFVSRTFAEMYAYTTVSEPSTLTIGTICFPLMGKKMVDSELEISGDPHAVAG